MKRFLIPMLAALALAGGGFYAIGHQAAEPPSTGTAATDPKTVEVWITETGKRYHRATCRYAKIKSNLAEAQAKGLTPCKVCNP